MIRQFSWSVMTLSAIAVAVYSLLLLTLPEMRSSFVEQLFNNLPSTTAIHFGGGAIAIVCGAIQFNPYLRKAALELHRWLGRAYVVAILFGGVSGLVLAVNSQAGVYAQMGFSGLAIAWLFTTYTAYRAIRQGNLNGHQRWMVRSYAVTLAGVTLRLYLGLTVASGLTLSEVYPIIAWLCWVPNVLLAEYYLRHHYLK